MKFYNLFLVEKFNYIGSILEVFILKIDRYKLNFDLLELMIDGKIMYFMLKNYEKFK